MDVWPENGRDRVTDGGNGGDRERCRGERGRDNEFWSLWRRRQPWDLQV